MTRKAGTFQLAGWLRPSILDVAFVAVFVWLVAFSVSDSGTGLLQDAFTGFHIRTGQYIVEHGAVPHTDVFSFTRAGQPWYEWEWLASVLFYAGFQFAGFKAIIIGAAAVLAGSMLAMVRHMVWRGANVFIAVGLMHVAVTVSSVHYLARPLIFTLLFMALALWLVDMDREKQSRAVWLLVPLCALWANLHAGFAGFLATVAIIATGCLFERKPRLASRYAALCGLCLLASGLNPYGFTEHLHVIQYMRDPSIQSMVQEFQPPKFGGFLGFYFEMMIVGSVVVVVRLLMKRQIASALMIAAWMHLALQSVRHMPILAIVLLPYAAAELAALWVLLMKKNASVRILEAIALDYRQAVSRVSVWPAVLVVFFALGPVGIAYPRDFSAERYPAALIARNADLLVSSRVFAVDSWSDYMIFRFYPRMRVFIDGRNQGFYGDAFPEEYLDVMYGREKWKAVLKKYGVDAVLVEEGSSVASLLRLEAGWRVVDRDKGAILFKYVKPAA
jgi:hypothetical protein